MKKKKQNKHMKAIPLAITIIVFYCRRVLKQIKKVTLYLALANSKQTKSKTHFIVKVQPIMIKF